MKKNIIIIGGGAGGMTLAAQLIKTMPQNRIMLFDKGPYVSWAGCPTPYYIAGQLSFKSVVHFSPDFFREKGIEIYENHLVHKINFKEKTIEVLGDKIEDTIPYDELILSIGGTPIIPNFTGYSPDIEGLFRLSHATDAKTIKEYIEEKSPKKAIVIGGGFIGIEMAEAFYENNIDVELIELQKRLMPKLPEDISLEILNRLQEKTIKVKLNSELVEIISEDKKIKSIRLSDGEIIETDLLLLSIGIKPNISLLSESNFEFEANNRVYVNEYLETYIPNVYALGDLIFNKHKLTNAMVYAPYGDVADKQAIVLSKVLNGDKSLKWKGVSGSFATSIFDLKIAGTGLNLEEAKELYSNIKTTNLRAMPRISGFGEKGVKIDVIYDDDKKIILGAFATGKEAVAQFIDSFSIAITHKIPIDELFNIDFPYSPTNSSVWNPLVALYRKVYK